MFVSSPEECQSEQTTWTPILFSSCEEELEEMIVHESEQRQTRRQVLIISPLQNQRRRKCNNVSFTSSCFGKPIPQQIKLCIIIVMTNRYAKSRENHDVRQLRSEFSVCRRRHAAEHVHGKIGQHFPWTKDVVNAEKEGRTVTARSWRPDSKR